MKQIGKCIIGDLRNVDDFTADWISVRIHPGVYYRRLVEFQKTLKEVKGMYAELDLGQYVLIRFSEKDDVTNFHRNHHTCL